MDENQKHDDLVLELNFVPAWARKPPQNVFERFSGEEREARGPRRPGRRDRRGPSRKPGAPRTDRRSDRRGPRPSQTGRRDDRAPRAPGRAPRPARGPREAGIPRAPVRATFIPNQQYLSRIVHLIRSSNRAYPLLELAHRFMSRPETCLVKLEPEPGASGLELFQCAACGVPALDQSVLVAHTFAAHFEEAFDVEEHTAEPPPGNFVCVARCGLSGALLGPPNHHSHEEKLREIHRTHYPDMPLEAYMGRIETLRDPELIEQWKQEHTHQRLYRLKGEKGTGREPMQWGEADAYFGEHVAPTFVTKARRAIVPALTAKKIEDRALMGAVRDAWNRETRFPRSFIFALRAAFRGMHLELFRVGKKADFVSPIRPAPLDPAHVVDQLREVLDYLKQNPGSTREKMTSELRPDAPADAPSVKEVIAPLSWLIERGHIIEFFDGSLSVPLNRRKAASS